MKKKTHEEFLNMVKEFPITIIGEYVDKRTKIEVSCDKCGNIWAAVGQSLYNGRGCSVCASKERGKQRAASYAGRYHEVNSIAQQYDNRLVFREAEPSSYKYCLRNGLLEEITGHMVKKKGKWSLISDIRKEALKYSTVSDFQENSVGAYKASRIKGIFDDITSHMERKGSDDNCIYIWRLVGEEFNDIQLYKVGITSTRLGDKRIKHCAKNGYFDYEIVLLKEVLNARILEQELLKYGINPKLTGFDGASEVRALSDVELDEILSTL